MGGGQGLIFRWPALARLPITEPYTGRFRTAEPICVSYHRVAKLSCGEETEGTICSPGPPPVCSDDWLG